MPEEINRVVADHLADALFCPSAAAVANLAAEGRTRGVHRSADVMKTVLDDSAVRAAASSSVLQRLGLTEKDFVLATLHRAENTDDTDRLRAIFSGLARTDETVVMPLHPRTRRALEAARIGTGRVQAIDPVGYLDMVRLEQTARLIVTDSGGVQKEAYWLGIPCVTARDETEWIETVQSGWNVLTGANAEKIASAIESFRPPAERPSLYVDGCAADGIVSALEGEHAA
jgi:UDP-N-acetylglucosamine 2-epimerase (non-hydrolysing)/UDP-GlcNAc3NAcA epimerase